MKLVIDANILFSALISPANNTASTIFFGSHELIAPAYLLDEIEEHKPELLKKSKLSADELNTVLGLLLSKIQMSEPVKISPNLISKCPDPDDVAYFALGISQKCAIWSNDKKLKNQNVVKVISTSELLEK